MNTQTDGHPVIFRTHKGNYVRTHAQTSAYVHALDVKNKKLEIRYVTDMYADNRLTCMHSY